MLIQRTHKLVVDGWTALRLPVRQELRLVDSIGNGRHRFLAIGVAAWPPSAQKKRAGALRSGRV